MRLWRKLLIWLLYPRLDRGVGYGVAIEVLWPMLMAVARWDFRGGRNVPGSGGALLAVNHLSHVDPIVLVAYCMSQGRVPRFLAMKELWGMRLVGAPLRGGRHIPVDRKASGIEAYRAAVESVKRGELHRRLPGGRVPVRVRRLAAEGPHRRRADGARHGRPRDPGRASGARTSCSHRRRRWARWSRAPPCGCSRASRSTCRTWSASRVGARPSPEATDRIMGRVTDELAILRGETPPAPEDRVSDGTKNG